MYSKKQIEELKQKIEKKIKSTKEDIVYLKEETKPISPENSIGRVSRMDAINNKSVAENSLRMSESVLSKLEESLENIHKDDFGKCQKCGKEIEFKRLLFIPESRRCTNCARQKV